MWEEKESQKSSHTHIIRINHNKGNNKKKQRKINQMKERIQLN